MYIYCCEILCCLKVLYVCGEKLFYFFFLIDILIKCFFFRVFDKKKLSYCICIFNSFVFVGFIIVINLV